MLYLCSRCGGVITEKQTIMEDDNGGKLHYACTYKMWQERLKKQEEELFKQTKERRKFLQKP